VQHAALRPPEHVVRAAVRLAVADVDAGHQPPPEAVHHLLRREVAPPLRDVALVAALVDDDRLPVPLAPLRSLSKSELWMLAWVTQGRAWSYHFAPLWIPRRWPYGSSVAIVSNTWSQRVIERPPMKSNSFASDHHTLRNEARRAIA
jgi:hypothetical protein